MVDGRERERSGAKWAFKKKEGLALPPETAGAATGISHHAYKLHHSREDGNSAKAKDAVIQHVMERGGNGMQISAGSCGAI